MAKYEERYLQAAFSLLRYENKFSNSRMSSPSNRIKLLLRLSHWTFKISCSRSSSLLIDPFSGNTSDEFSTRPGAVQMNHHRQAEGWRVGVKPKAERYSSLFLQGLTRVYLKPNMFIRVFFKSFVSFQVCIRKKLSCGKFDSITRGDKAVAFERIR